MDRKLRIPLFLVSVLLGMIVCAMLSACEAGVSFSTGTKTFFPDRYGQESFLGDPRKPMYEGSGYTESWGAGSSSGFKGFEGMGGGK